MKKIGFILVAILAIVVGLIVGTLNSGPVQLNLLWTQLELPLGLTILSGFALGLVAGLVILFVVRVVPLRLQLRKARATLHKQETSITKDTSGLNLPND